MIIEIQEKLQTPYMFSIRMLVMLMYPLWSSMAMSIAAHSSTYLRTVLAGLCVENAYVRRVYKFNNSYYSRNKKYIR